MSRALALLAALLLVSVTSCAQGEVAIGNGPGYCPQTDTYADPCAPFVPRACFAGCNCTGEIVLCPVEDAGARVDASADAGQGGSWVRSSPAVPAASVELAMLGSGGFSGLDAGAGGAPSVGAGVGGVAGAGGAGGGS